MDIHKPISEDSEPILIPIEDNRKITLMTEFLDIHHTFQHISFKRLKEMSIMELYQEYFVAETF